MKRPIAVWVIAAFYLLNLTFFLWQVLPELVDFLRGFSKRDPVDMILPSVGFGLRGFGVIRLLFDKLGAWISFLGALILDLPIFLMILIGIAALITNPLAILILLISWTTPWLVITIYAYYSDKSKRAEQGAGANG